KRRIKSTSNGFIPNHQKTMIAPCRILTYTFKS
ncbi:hypothetical protein V3C99_015944, partial [Haemonchus contortus]|uniref:Transposase n=1 Tax=Haemonchus contortus TaxID=6289 RepID=A0A7I5ED70_HAECO